MMFEYDTIKRALPHQGAVEVQQDQPGKVHDWHTHDTDETLLILEGSLVVQVEDGDAVVQRQYVPTERILLPKGTKHKSVASEEGAIYVIAFRLLPEGDTA